MALGHGIICGIIYHIRHLIPALYTMHTILFTISTCAQRTGVHSCPQHWLLCHLGLYYFEFEFPIAKRHEQIAKKCELMNPPEHA